jgi:hypothetical protein
VEEELRVRARIRKDGELGSWEDRRDLIRAPPCLPVAPETRRERTEDDMLDAEEDGCG